MVFLKRFPSFPCAAVVVVVIICGSLAQIFQYRSWQAGKKFPCWNTRWISAAIGSFPRNLLPAKRGAGWILRRDGGEFGPMMIPITVFPALQAQNSPPVFVAIGDTEATPACRLLLLCSEKSIGCPTIGGIGSSCYMRPQILQMPVQHPQNRPYGRGFLGRIFWFSHNFFAKKMPSFATF